MDIPFDALVAGITGGSLTLFELDRVFYVPRNTAEKTRLYLWWWGFVLANAALAFGFCTWFRTQDSVKSLDPILRGLALGASYLALVRLKIATVTVNNNETPVGFEALYEAAKLFVYKRINAIAQDSRANEVEELSKGALADLLSKARSRINSNALLDETQKVEAKEWLTKVAKDAAAEEADKRRAIADFILSGYRASDFK
jgi:hypothetical protein